MRINPPPELSDYRYDEEAGSRSALLPRIIGWLSFLCLSAAVAALFFLKSGKTAVMGLFFGFMVLFTVYIVLKVAKGRARCSRCGRPMEMLDVQYTHEQWKQVMQYDLVGGYRGADGFLYSDDKERRSGSAPHYMIHAHLQTWSACHECRRTFLKTKYWRETPFTTIDENEYQEAKRSVLSDPGARDKMLKAYQDRLRGI
ncbi:hypothetical protein JW948_17440 [bacterium]|nr:hypothetical protein [bacterium]